MFLRAVPTLTILAACTSFAHAQQCGLRNTFRMVHTLCDGGGETRIDTGLVPAGPLLTTTSVNPTNACGCESEIAVIASSEFGSLAYNVVASGQSCACCGIFMWVDDGDGGPFKARFIDRITPTSTTLPAGTPVTFRATLHVLGGVSASNAGTQRTFAGELRLLGPINRQLRLDDTQGSVIDTFQSPVGQAIDITGSIYCTLRDQVLLGLNATGAFGANINVVTTIEMLTPDVTVVSCSGHDYAPVPTCAADLDNDGNLANGAAPDGAVDISDLLYFLAAFEAGNVDLDNDGDPAAGVPDGATDISDLLFFLARFEAGC